MKEESSITLTVGKKLRHLCSPSHAGERCRKRLSQLHSLAMMELGFLPPLATCVHSTAIDDYSYAVSVNSYRVHLGYIPHEGTIVLGDFPEFESLPGDELYEPLTGLPCRIADPDETGRALPSLHVIEGLDLICLALYQAFTWCSHHLFDDKAYRAWLDIPAVSAARKAIPADEDTLRDVLYDLLRMGISIFPSPDLLKALGEELARKLQDAHAYSEALRKRLIASRDISLERDYCKAFHIADDMRQRLTSLMLQKESMTTKMLEEEGREILQAMSSFIYPVIREGKNPAAITPPEIRHFTERLCRQIYPELSIIASDEIDSKIIPFMERKTVEPAELARDPLSIDTRRWFKGRYSHFVSECLKSPVFYKVAPLRDGLGRRALVRGACLISDENPEGVQLLRQSVALSPSSFLAIHILGEHYLSKDSISEALALMHEAMAHQAGYPAFLVGRARKLFREGEKKLPHHLLAAAIELEQDNHEAYCLLGEISGLDGNYSDAEKAAAKSIELSGGNPAAWRLMGRLQLEQEQFEEAQDSFLKALSYDSDDPLSRYGLAMSYYHRGKGHEAELELYRALKVDPEMDRAYYRLGCIYMITGRNELAEEHFQKALSLDGHNAEYHASLGILCAEEGDYVRAIRYLNKALGIMPAHPGWLSLCAGLYQESGELEEALRLYDRLILISYNESASYQAKGLLLLEMGRGQEGMEALSDSIRCDPGNISAFEALGWALLSMGDLKKAEKIFLKGLSIDGSATSLLYGLGNACLHSGRLSEAGKAAEKLLMTDRNSLEGQILQGRILARKGDGKKALQYLRNALSVRKGDEALMCEVASLTLEQGNIREAVQMMEGLTEGEEPCSEAWLILGRACRKAGRVDDARRAWTEGLSSFPQNGAFYLELFMLYDECGEFERMRALVPLIEKNIPDDITGRGVIALTALSFYDLDSAEEKFRALLKEKKASWISHSYLSLIAFLKQDYKKAEKESATAQKERGEKVCRDSFLGELALITGKEELYEERCTAFLRSNSDDLQAMKSLGAFYLKKGELSSALPLLQRCRKKNPRLSGIAALMSELYYRQGRLGKAEETLREGLRLCPRNPELHLKLGRLAFIRGDRHDGEHSMRQAIAYAPPRPGLLYSLAFQAELGNWSEVKALYSRLDSYLKDSHDASVCHVMALVEEGSYGESLKACTRIARHCGDRYLSAELTYLESTIFSMTGEEGKMKERLQIAADEAVDVGNAMLAEPFLLYLQGDLAQARALTESALRKRHAFAEALFLMGLLEQKEGNTNGAEKFYGKALRLSPHHRRYRERPAILSGD